DGRRGASPAMPRSSPPCARSAGTWAFLTGSGRDRPMRTPLLPVASRRSRSASRAGRECIPSTSGSMARRFRSEPDSWRRSCAVFSSSPLDGRNSSSIGSYLISHRPKVIMAQMVLEGVSEFLGEAHGLLIDGEEREARSGERFDVLDPATGEVVATAPSGGPADVDDAVAAAREAFPTWRELAPATR